MGAHGACWQSRRPRRAFFQAGERFFSAMQGKDRLMLLSSGTARVCTMKLAVPRDAAEGTRRPPTAAGLLLGLPCPPAGGEGCFPPIHIKSL